MKFYSNIYYAANFNEFARHNADMGMDKGSPDLRLESIHDNITYILYLELKTKKGKLSKDQIKWNENFDKNRASSNCKRAVAFGFDDAKKIITDWQNNLLTIEKL